MPCGELCKLDKKFYVLRRTREGTLRNRDLNLNIYENFNDDRLSEPDKKSY